MKKNLIFMLGELIILLGSLFGGAIFLFPIMLNVFESTSKHAYDFFTPALFALPSSIVMVALPLTIIWYLCLYKKR